MKRVARRMKAAVLPYALNRTPRYILASPHKTATTTVGHALVTLGAGQAEMPHSGDLLPAHRRTIRRLNLSIPREARARDWIASHGAAARAALRGLMPVLTRYDVFHDAPFGHGHIHPFILKAMAPGARFIWVNRPRKAWMRSVRAWEETHPEIYPRHVEWQTDPDMRRRELRKLWQRRLTRFRRLADDYPDDCLELDSSELRNWAALSEFCDQPVPGGAPAALNVRRD